MKQDGELSPERAALLQRIASLSGRVGAARRQAQPGYSGQEATAAARGAYWQRLLDEADPEGRMSSEEREAHARALWRQRMAEGQLKKAQAKLKKAGR
jgi:hypothetical protein